MIATMQGVRGPTGGDPSPWTRTRAFEQLYADHAGRVLAYARRRTDDQAAHDVVAETFLVLWRRMDDAPADPLPWLLGVARRQVANRHRGDRRRAALQQRARQRAALQQGDHADGVAEQLLVHAALATLGDRDREAITLVTWDGLSHRQAAQAVGCSTGALAVRLHRARRKLAGALRGLGAGPAQAGDGLAGVGERLLGSPVTAQEDVA
jgi:RNA polymerase sigma-70 factor (ECF subfamily)